GGHDAVEAPRGCRWSARRQRQGQRLERVLAPGDDVARAAERADDAEDVPGAVRAVLDAAHARAMLRRHAGEWRRDADGRPISRRHEHTLREETAVSGLDLVRGGAGGGAHLVERGRAPRRREMAIHGGAEAEVEVLMVLVRHDEAL